MPEPLQLALAPATLGALDALQCELLAVGCFLEDRPLRGVAGLLDWRLNGWLSRLTEQGRFSGTPGEQLLCPTGTRVGPRRVLLFGLGERTSTDEDRLAEVLERCGTTFAGLKLQDLAFSVLDLLRAEIPRRRILPMVTTEVGWQLRLGRATLQKMTLLVSPEDYRTMNGPPEGGPGNEARRKRSGRSFPVLGSVGE